MAQHYSNPTREADPYALPDVETFHHDGINQDLAGVELSGAGWYYWFCFPGCLPDSEPLGPFATEDEALEDARMNAYDLSGGAAGGTTHSTRSVSRLAE